MRNKKIWSLLLVMTMLVALVIPVQAAETETTLLTKNTFSEARKTMVEAALGKTVKQVSTIKEKATMTSSSNMQKDSQPLDVSNKLQDGNYAARQVGVDPYFNSATDGYIDIDLGRAQTVESVMIWQVTNDLWQNRPEITDTLWESYTALATNNIMIQTSADGETWEETPVYNAAPEARTAANVEYAEWPKGYADKVAHSFVCNLSEAANTRYLRVTLNVRNQFNLAEIMVFGQASAVDRKIISGNGYGQHHGNLGSPQKYYAKYGYNAIVYPHLATYHYETYKHGGFTHMTDRGYNLATDDPNYTRLNKTIPWISLGETSANSDAVTGSEEEGTAEYFQTPKLTQGSFGQKDGYQCCNSEGWGQKSASVVFDLGQIMTVTGTDVEAYRDNMSSTSQGLSSVKVEYKDAQGEWQIALAETPVSLNDGTLIQTGNNTMATFQDFAPVQAQYVKVSMVGQDYQLTLSEVAIIGEPPEIPATATTPVFVDSNGNNYVIDQSTSLNATTTFSGCEGTLIVAWYDETDALQKIYVASGTGAVSINVPQEDELAFLDSTGDKMKAFAFESVADASILADVAELNLGK